MVLSSVPKYLLSVSRLLTPFGFRLLLVLCEPAPLSAYPIYYFLEDNFLLLDCIYQPANVLAAVLFRSNNSFVRFFWGRNS